jgi:predicted ATPase with chaperone activity
MLMVGPPVAGKSMLAARLPSILTARSNAEASGTVLEQIVNPTRAG